MHVWRWRAGVSANGQSLYQLCGIVNQTRLASAAELESTLRNYVKIYNHSIPQRALKHKTPIQALKEWREERPELFRKRVYNQAGLDT